MRKMRQIFAGLLVLLASLGLMALAPGVARARASAARPDESGRAA